MSFKQPNLSEVDKSTLSTLSKKLCVLLKADPARYRLDIFDQPSAADSHDDHHYVVRYTIKSDTRRSSEDEHPTRSLSLSVPILGAIAQLTYTPIDINVPTEEVPADSTRVLRAWIVELFSRSFDTVVEILGRLGVTEALLHRLIKESGAVASLFWVVDSDSAYPTLKLRSSSGVEVGSVDIPLGYGVVGSVTENDSSLFEDLERVQSITNPELVKREKWRYCQAFPLVRYERLQGVVAMYYRTPLPDSRRESEASIARIQIIIKQLEATASETVLLRERRYFETTLADRANDFLAGLTVLGLIHDLKKRFDNVNVTATAIADALPTDDDDLASLANTLLRLGISSTSPIAFQRTLFSFKNDVDYIARIISTINRISEARSRKREKLDLGDVVTNVSPLLSALEVDRGRVLYKIGRGLIIRAAENDIARILMNLVSNSFAWGARRVRVEVAGVTSGAAVTEVGQGLSVSLTVIDDGQGMSSSVLARCREPFYTDREGGTGLGLFVVDRLVQQLGGRMALTSTLGRGTTVVIELPGLV